eukprot:TRINITY_DN17389_c0_g1_i1.p1 TRINITY_DN17389_c0_g1~~TRINITY_DN17389_c0_g1_i1.p1  ORF type:complete len:214 (-),score=8.87 TRINITY_DN17389_c0_g1_i1:116-757(-)
MSSNPKYIMTASGAFVFADRINTKTLVSVSKDSLGPGGAYATTARLPPVPSFLDEYTRQHGKSRTVGGSVKSATVTSPAAKTKTPSPPGSASSSNPRKLQPKPPERQTAIGSFQQRQWNVLTGFPLDAAADKDRRYRLTHKPTGALPQIEPTFGIDCSQLSVSGDIPAERPSHMKDMNVGIRGDKILLQKSTGTSANNPLLAAGTLPKYVVDK